MSARRKDTKSRLTLFRDCAVCGKSIVTTADTPWLRNVRGKNCYYCSHKCFYASYIHKGFVDGLTAERKKITEANRDISAKNRKYYWSHREQMIERARKYRAEHPEVVKADNEYYKRRRKMLDGIRTRA